MVYEAIEMQTVWFTLAHTHMRTMTEEINQILTHPATVF